MYPIFMFGSESQKEYWLPRLAKGDAIGCFGLTEPDHGSDPGGMIARAEKKGTGYVLNGAKMWITNGTIADVAVVWAKLNGEIRGFLVEKGAAGFSAPEMKGKHSLRASVTSELNFKTVKFRRKYFAKVRRIKITADVFGSSTVRDCVGRGGCGHGLL